MFPFPDATFTLRGRCDFPGRPLNGDIASMLPEVPREDLASVWFLSVEAPSLLLIPEMSRKRRAAGES
jgi:hypothetical protein